MAKKQTRRSISVSRGTYERLKAYCETNQISMSQFVERRVGDYLGRSGASVPLSTAAPSAPTRQVPQAVQPQAPVPTPVRTDAFEVTPPSPVAPPTAVYPAARAEMTPVPTPPPRMSSINQPLSQAVSSPNPVVKPSSDEPLLKDPDAKLTADQIFTF